MCSPFGVGSDIGGSIRNPAHVNGIFALKPTSGRIAYDGHQDISPFFNDHGHQHYILPTMGPMCKSADDVEILMKIMSKTVLQFFLNLTGYLILLTALIFPVVNFKISASSAVFPSLEIIIIYYLSCYCRTGTIKILLLSLFIDQLYALPVGSSILAFVVGQLAIKVASKWFLTKEYVGNFFLFCAYCLLIFFLRYLAAIAEANYPSLFELVFQYLITVFSYPVSRVALDKMSELFNYQTKNA